MTRPTKRTKKFGTETEAEIVDFMCPGTRIAFNVRRGITPGVPHDRRFRGHPRSDGELGPLVGGMAPSWGLCWKCGRPLGCTMCTTTNACEIMCVPCCAWGTKQAFDHHGPFVNAENLQRKRAMAFPQHAKNGKIVAAELHEYPEKWRRNYDPHDISHCMTGKGLEQALEYQQRMNAKP